MIFPLKMPDFGYTNWKILGGYPYRLKGSTRLPCHPLHGAAWAVDRPQVVIVDAHPLGMSLG
jgi:hypothetical protein